ncbi:hypothetical protein EC973_004883 [Apophysomyces ossiformis]|uniref:Uncharacterized protein n=1 Tax=Apophysomyces ossiformis TaxID=679940 RepID=A0A8H7BSD2_9FUNG|nr:hypothetical protein EC973_004883 [Apophysomyces ossiformis]
MESDYEPIHQDEHQESVWRRPEMASKLSLAAGRAGMGTEGGIYQLIERVDSVTDGMDDEIEMQAKLNEHSEAEPSSATTSIPVTHGTDTARKEEESSAGILLGIHNMYLVLPQFMVTFLSSILFHFLERKDAPNDTEHASPEAMGVVLRVGAVMAGIAGYLSTRIGRE